eukprot:1527510-Rhodomonas_salina.3
MIPGTDVASGVSAYAHATRCPILTWHFPVSAYALTTPCPVLTWHMVLPGWAAVELQRRVAAQPGQLRYLPTRLLCDVRCLSPGLLCNISSLALQPCYAKSTVCLPSF